MRWYPWLAAGLLPAALALPLAARAADNKAPQVHWKKTVLDRRFRAEGVAVADVNRDGRPDVLVGDVWYEAPDWKEHPIRPAKSDYREGDKNVYSNAFACWADDINGDGWPDLIVVGFPGAPCHWYENPRGKEGMWKEHEIWHSACNETPQYVDLFGTGKRVLVMGWQPKGKENEGQMAWFTPGKDPTRPWEMHPISAPSQPGKPVPGTFKFSHGLGAGDLNGDGRLDVICTGGWWEQPAKDDGKPWKFHPADLGPDCADMFAYDMNGDGLADVLSSSAHNYGIWWHEQKRGADGKGTTFVRHDIFPHLVSQTHALHFVDINGDGLKDLVTGKRYWAHGNHGDADPNAAAVLYWFEASKSADGSTHFTPHGIDDDSGIGTQFAIADMNGDGLPDVVVANKKGVFVFEQSRTRGR
ncbi:MAG TPA: VCBS repeat-containing protein [Gemmataceae bacterium]|nr:VCBS repeat-containing protein [Gemmataceae bacterium]